MVPSYTASARQDWRTPVLQMKQPPRTKQVFMALACLFLLLTIGFTGRAFAATAADLDRDAIQALETLSKTHQLASEMRQKASAILVFPNIVQAGLVFGGAYGEGVLLKGSAVDDYYNSVSASWGFQIGAQSFSYVVFLMTPDAVDYVANSNGWEIGVGPTIVVVDEGAAKNLTSSSLQDEAYAFIFSQQGLMASVSIEGTKITKIKR